MEHHILVSFDPNWLFKNLLKSVTEPYIRFRIRLKTDVYTIATCCEIFKVAWLKAPMELILPAFF